jgi:hypothetical protein
MYTEKLSSLVLVMIYIYTYFSPKRPSALLHTGVIARLTSLTVASLVLHKRTSHFTPERVGWIQEGSFVSIDGWTLPNQVGGHGFLKLGLLENLPEGESNNCQELSQS